MRSFRRRFAAALALGTLTSTGGALAGSGDDLVACREKGQIEVRKDGWTRISAPPVDTGEGAANTVLDFAMTPQAPNRLYATNGTSVKLSADGGCTWNLLDTAPRYRLPNGGHAVPRVYTHVAAPSDDTLWIASHEDTAAPRPHIHRLDNLRPNAKAPVAKNEIENGLPAVGRAVELLASSMAGESSAYLLLEQPPDPTSGDVETPTRRLYVTYIPTTPPQLGALGLMWKEVAAPAGFGRIEGIALGPSSGNLWMWSANKVAMTPAVSAGSSVVPATSAEQVKWVVPTLPAGTVTGVDVDATGLGLVVLETAQKGVMAVAVDSRGAISTNVSVPVAPVSMTHGRRAGTRAISGKSGTFGYDTYARRWVDITPKRVGPLQGLAMGNGRAARILLGHTGAEIYRFDLYAGESFLPGRDGPTGLGYPDIPYSDIKTPYINPETKVVTVRPGETKDVAAEFGMPPAVNPLDVYFLVDTTGSMQSTIVSLRESIKSIADRMRDELGREACFGVGDFKDINPTGGGNLDQIFRTHLRITCESDPALPRVGAALQLLKSSGGGDLPEAQTVALTQMLTGEGHPNPPVLPGQDAGFRHDAYKVVVLITDAPANQGGGYPMMTTAAKKLKVNAVKVVNVLVLTDQGDQESARRDMTELAEGTDSMAPPGGVDCDGDGKIGAYDATAGEPLICDTNGTEPNVGPVIVSLLLGVEDPGTLAVKIGDPHKAIRKPIRGATSRIVNLKREARLPFTMPVGCTAAQDGLDLPITLTPTVRAVPLGLSGQVVVQCRAKPVVPIVKPPVPPQIPEPIEPPPIVNLPRIPVAIAVPPPPPNPVPQPPSNINPNAGFSQQEEQQFQLAAVTQGAGEETQQDEEVELAMSRLDRDLSATPVAAFLAGATMLSTAAGVAYRRRLQRAQRVAYVRVR